MKRLLLTMALVGLTGLVMPAHAEHTSGHEGPPPCPLEPFGETWFQMFEVDALEIQAHASMFLYLLKEYEEQARMKRQIGEGFEDAPDYPELLGQLLNEILIATWGLQHVCAEHDYTLRWMEDNNLRD